MRKPNEGGCPALPASQGRPVAERRAATNETHRRFLVSSSHWPARGVRYGVGGEARAGLPVMLSPLSSLTRSPSLRKRRYLRDDEAHAAYRHVGRRIACRPSGVGKCGIGRIGFDHTAHRGRIIVMPHDPDLLAVIVGERRIRDTGAG